MLKRTFQTLAAISPLLVAGTASAMTITADNSWNGQSAVTVSGVTIAACNTTSSCAGTLGSKAIPTIGAGIGVQGHGNNEIDWDNGVSEMLRFSFSTASVINSLELGLLFDGPEYSDYLEVATFRVTYSGGGTSIFSLVPNYNLGTANAWGGSGSWSGTDLVNGGAGRWIDGANPFGSGAITQLDMYASAGSCAPGLSCSDQSDYLFRSLTATPVEITQTNAPEPATLLLLGTGLAGMGVATRRRRRKV